MMDTPPRVPSGNRFLGTSRLVLGDFSDEDNVVLAAGPGRILGTVQADGLPVEGLKLRLALNGSVMSQWTTSGRNGRYEIPVPYAAYRIDGYELDRVSANDVLVGTIRHPQTALARPRFRVDAESPGQGLDLRFVEPVILDMQKTRFSADEEIVIHWQAYPGAHDYSVEIYERPAAPSQGKIQSLFAGSDRPVAGEPHLNLADHGIELKPGHEYSVALEARGQGQEVISRSAPSFGYDFQVIE